MSRGSRLRWALSFALLFCFCASLLAQDKPQLKDDHLTPDQIPPCSLDTKLANGDLEILSDTLGVDFGPYLREMWEKVRKNWYAVIPGAAYPPLREQGTVVLRFRILKNGSIAELNFVCRSGDLALDRAAYAGVSKSSRFAPLPKEFHGDFLALRMRFTYNPDRKKPDKAPPADSQK